MKGLCKKIAATILAFLMLVSVLITAVPPEGFDWAMEAEAVSGYNATEAGKYAIQWCGVPSKENNYNSNYNTSVYWYQGGADCAPFVSQCLVAGGLQTNKKWYPQSWYWNFTGGLWSYLQNDLGVTIIENLPLSDIEVGDVIFVDWHWCKNWNGYGQGANGYGHVVICSDIVNGIPWYCGHTEDTHSSLQGYHNGNWAVAKMNGTTSNPSTPTSAPTGPDNLTGERKVYSCSESITFTWDEAQYATEYWVYLWKDGVQLYSVNMGEKTAFTSAPTSAGNYSIIVRAGNSVGFSGGARYDFYVTDNIPGNISNIRTTEDYYVPNDIITFEWDGDKYAESYSVYFWKDGAQISSKWCGSTTSYTTTLQGAGKYTLIVTSENINGVNDASEWYTFSVSDTAPYNPENVYLNKYVYSTSESIPISWDKSPNTTEYWIYMWKDGVQIYAQSMHTCA